MTVLVLKRFSRVDATYGVFLYEGIPIAFSLELPWKHNRVNLSCIPVGGYDVSKYYSHKHKSCFFVHDVNGRSSILIHAGNSLKDTQGCILVGKSYSSDGVLLNSRATLENLLDLMPPKFRLHIIDC